VTQFKASVHSPLLSQIVMSDAKKYTIKFLVKCINMGIVSIKQKFTIDRTYKVYRKISFCSLINKIEYSIFFNIFSMFIL